MLGPEVFPWSTSDRLVFDEIKALRRALTSLEDFNMGATAYQVALKRKKNPRNIRQTAIVARIVVTVRGADSYSKSIRPNIPAVP